MKTITELIKAIMLLINAGGIARIMILIMNIIADPDTIKQNLLRIRNVVIFMVFTILIYSLKDAVLEYFK
ncbi:MULTISPECIES: hypothetical protein [Anaerostipes]|uniref:hypothetical protein n=1 Tax=Anaerostipes TaxID=207244 RepID=UPI0006C038E2|nr:hypothetical protein [Anaerostipes amylophilus]MCU6781872.1 hypothetical protein [Anaerostipes amylophilus]CUO31562.1 Uncharacterised protein [Anaerostipes hadrus]